MYRYVNGMTASTPVNIDAQCTRVRVHTHTRVVRVLTEACKRPSRVYINLVSTRCVNKVTRLDNDARQARGDASDYGAGRAIIYGFD